MGSQVPEHSTAFEADAMARDPSKPDKGLSSPEAMVFETRPRDASDRSPGPGDVWTATPNLNSIPRTIPDSLSLMPTLASPVAFKPINDVQPANYKLSSAQRRPAASSSPRSTRFPLPTRRYRCRELQQSHDKMDSAQLEAISAIGSTTVACDAGLHRSNGRGPNSRNTLNDAVTPSLDVAAAGPELLIPHVHKDARSHHAARGANMGEPPINQQVQTKRETQKDRAPGIPQQQSTKLPRS
jgi:hypothetical protein